MPIRKKRRGRRKKFKIKLNVRNETIRSTLAISLILAAGVVLVSFLASGYSANAKIQEMLRYLFGYAHILLAPIFLISGLLLVSNIKWRFVELRILIGFVVMIIATSGLLHSFYTKNAYKMAKEGMGGGLIGYKISELLADTISMYGGVLVLVGLIVISLILILDRSLDEIAEFSKRYTEKLGFKGKLFSGLKMRKEKSTEDSDQDEIQISTGINMEGSEQPETEPTPPQQEETAQKPRFDVIPSMAEPQGADNATIQTGTGNTVPAIPTLPYSDKVWELPPLDLLENKPNVKVDRGDVTQRAKIIKDTLASFNIKVEVKDIRYGPSVTQYALEAASGTKIAKISSLQYDLALALASPTGSVRIEAPIPGRSLIGIEVPNNNRIMVNFKELLTSDQMKGMKENLGIVLGLDVGGVPMVHNISKMPHMLIAGSTGSGKSVFIQTLLFSLLFRNSPQECKLILIDPKRVELKHYDGIPHLLAPVITDTEKAPAIFRWAIDEMERRYKLIEAAKVRDIKSYNNKSGFQAMPYIVIVVDELGEIMVRDPASVEKSIVRLAQMARAVGIHLILSLQRPSTNVVTGLIKANIPCRVAFNVTNMVDSRVIIDQPGAEKLMGKGDMLFVPPDASKPTRIQGPFVTDGEINGLIKYLKSRGVAADPIEDIFDVPDNTKSVSSGGDGVDAKYNEALEIVTREGKASASLLQRRLSIGYSRAARILDELEAKGVIGPARGSKPREIINKGAGIVETPIISANMKTPESVETPENLPTSGFAKPDIEAPPVSGMVPPTLE